MKTNTRTLCILILLCICSSLVSAASIKLTDGSTFNGEGTCLVGSNDACTELRITKGSLQGVKWTGRCTPVKMTKDSVEQDPRLAPLCDGGDLKNCPLLNGEDLKKYGWMGWKMGSLPQEEHDCLILLDYILTTADPDYKGFVGVEVENALYKDGSLHFDAQGGRINGPFLKTKVMYESKDYDHDGTINVRESVNFDREERFFTNSKVANITYKVNIFKTPTDIFVNNGFFITATPEGSIEQRVTYASEREGTHTIKKTDAAPVELTSYFELNKFPMTDYKTHFIYGESSFYLSIPYEEKTLATKPTISLETVNDVTWDFTVEPLAKPTTIDEERKEALVKEYRKDFLNTGLAEPPARLFVWYPKKPYYFVFSNDQKSDNLVLTRNMKVEARQETKEQHVQTYNVTPAAEWLEFPLGYGKDPRLNCILACEGTYEETGDSAIEYRFLGTERFSLHPGWAGSFYVSGSGLIEGKFEHERLGPVTFGALLGEPLNNFEWVSGSVNVNTHEISLSNTDFWLTPSVDVNVTGTNGLLKVKGDESLATVTEEEDKETLTGHAIAASEEKEERVVVDEALLDNTFKEDYVFLMSSKKVVAARRQLFLLAFLNRWNWAAPTHHVIEGPMVKGTNFVESGTTEMFALPGSTAIKADERGVWSITQSSLDEMMAAGKAAGYFTSDGSVHFSARNPSFAEWLSKAGISNLVNKEVAAAVEDVVEAQTVKGERNVETPEKAELVIGPSEGLHALKDELFLVEKPRLQTGKEKGFKTTLALQTKTKNISISATQPLVVTRSNEKTELPFSIKNEEGKLLVKDPQGFLLAKGVSSASLKGEKEYKLVVIPINLAGWGGETPDNFLASFTAAYEEATPLRECKGSADIHLLKGVNGEVHSASYWQSRVAAFNKLQRTSKEAFYLAEQQRDYEGMLGLQYALVNGECRIWYTQCENSLRGKTSIYGEEFYTTMVEGALGKAAQGCYEEYKRVTGENPDRVLFYIPNILKAYKGCPLPVLNRIGAAGFAPLGGAFAVASSGVFVATHELGHTYYLKDQYCDCGEASIYPCGTRAEPNPLRNVLGCGGLLDPDCIVSESESWSMTDKGTTVSCASTKGNFNMMSHDTDGDGRLDTGLNERSRSIMGDQKHGGSWFSIEEYAYLQSFIHCPTTTTAEKDSEGDGEATA